MASNIRFIPSQMDVLAGTSTEAARKNPLRLLVQDAGILLSMLRYLPWIVLPFKTSEEDAELHVNPRSIRDMVLHALLCVMEIILLLLAPFAILLLPGGILVAVAALCCLVVYLISFPMLGPRTVYSKMDAATARAAKQHEHERWLFVNGCVTGHRGLQNNVNRLSKTFGRPVIGIHNQTYGLIGDLLECLIQRCLSYSSMDARVAFDYVKACLADPTVTKVVLIGHSQGGIIVSLVVDRLFTDLPTETISKLEVYTFASAASHCNNPRLSLKPRSSATKEVRPANPLSQRCIPYIEHYCNEYDMIPRWGVLYNVMEILDNRYSGKVFIRMGASGHMFNQHYMDPMFPLDRTRTSHFLDQVVDVDEKLASRRESKAVEQMGLMRRESGFPVDGVNCGDGQMAPVGLIVDEERRTNGTNGLINFVEPTMAAMGEARGKTVRQLSRLWRYTDGGSPAEAEAED